MEKKQQIENKNIKSHPAGFLIIRPAASINEKHIPLECPVCSLLMRDYSDVMSFNKWECCDECYITWANTSYNKWKDGWRPTSEDIDLARKKRLSLPTYGVR